MCLHNFCKDVDDTEANTVNNVVEYAAAQALMQPWRVNMPSNSQRGRRGDLDSSAARDAVIADIERQGLARPYL